MALTECNGPAPVFEAARGNALARLPGLTGELSHDLAQSRFLARSPLACMALLAGGAAALWLCGASLKAGFGWSALILIGITAMVRNFIRGAARSLRRIPLAEAAQDLRLLLLYSGAAWASGAFLLMPESPAPALAVSFAVAPCLALGLILKDTKAVLGFTAPTVLGVAGAAILGAWPLDIWVASAICAAGLGIILLPALQQAEKNMPPALDMLPRL